MSIASRIESEGYGGSLDELVDRPIRIPFRDSPRRTASQRFGARFPRLFNATGRLIRSLPMRSRTRRFMFRKALTDGVAAYNRRDWQSVLLNVATDVEVNPPSGMVSLGFQPAYRGHDGYLDYQRRWIEHWGDFRVVPRVAIDLEDRMVVLGQMGGREPRTGVPIDTEFGTLDTYRGARLVRQQVFLSHADALRAAGLYELATVRA